MSFFSNQVYEEIHHWLQKLREDVGSEATLEVVVRDYHVQGEKVVAADMVPRCNDKFYSLWLMLRTFFRHATGFLNDHVATTRRDTFRISRRE